jgi:hypothetical protein
VTIASQYRGLDAALEGLAEFADRSRRRIALSIPVPEEEEPPEDSGAAGVYERVREGVRFERPSAPQPRGGLEAIQTLPTFLRGVGVGDVDGDQLNDIVLMDERTLWIYKEADGRLRLFKKIEGHRNDSFLTLDVADVNRNGYSEIFVSNLRGTVPRSFILEFEEKRIKKLGDREKWLYRVINQPGKGLALVGQKMGPSRGPVGKIYPFVWQGGKFVPSETPVTRKQIPVFSFDVGDVEGRGEPRIIYVDYTDTIQVVDTDGAFIWESPTKYGGSDIFFPLGATGQDRIEDRMYIPGRLILTDLDGDGISEVLVSKNDFKLDILQKLKVYDQARLVLLSWRGTGLMESWKTPDISGYISDYQIRDVDNDGRNEVVIAAVSKRPLSGKASSSVLIYEFF